MLSSPNSKSFEQGDRVLMQLGNQPNIGWYVGTVVDRIYDDVYTVQTDKIPFKGSFLKLGKDLVPIPKEATDEQIEAIKSILK